MGPTPRTEGTCQACGQGELISVSMSVSDTELTFTTCHLCEARWWLREGREVSFQSVIGMVVDTRS